MYFYKYIIYFNKIQGLFEEFGITFFFEVVFLGKLLDY